MMNEKILNQQTKDSFLEIESGGGEVYQSEKHVSLEDMEEAIAKGASDQF